MLASVFAVRNAEAEVEIEALQQLIAEVMPFDHAEVLDLRIADDKLDSEWEEHEKGLNIASKRKSHEPQASQWKEKLEKKYQRLRCNDHEKVMGATAEAAKLRYRAWHLYCDLRALIVTIE